jgi:hypothetical protein
VYFDGREVILIHDVFTVVRIAIANEITFKIAYLLCIILGEFEVREIEVDIKEVIDESQFEFPVMMKELFVVFKDYTQGIS